MNKCSFTGRLVDDPVLTTFDSGMMVTRFCLAVDRRFKNSSGQWESDPSFLDFEVWDTSAKVFAEKYRKGDFILIADASIKTDRWTDKQGQKHRKLCFRCNHFESVPLANERSESEGRKPARAEKANTAHTAHTAQPAPPAPSYRPGKGKQAIPDVEYEEIRDLAEDDVPF